jgi:hypothetical protein
LLPNLPTDGNGAAVFTNLMVVEAAGNQRFEFAGCMAIHVASGLVIIGISAIHFLL